MLRKILMAASLVVTLFANSAMAGTWTATSGAPVFASELFGDGTAVITPTTAVYTMSATPGAGSAFNVDFTLGSGTWGAALTSGSLVLAGGGGAGSVTLVDGGALAGNTAKFRIDVGTSFTGNRTLTLTYTITGVTAADSAAAAAAATLAVALSDQLGALDTAGAATTVASSINGTSIAGVGTGVGNIDVTTGSVNFTSTSLSTTTSDLGNFTITDTAGAGAGREDGNDADWSAGSTDAAITSGTLTFTGDFSASVGVDGDSNALTNDGLALSGCLTANATTLTASSATFTLTQANIVSMLGTACDVTLTVDGTTAISETTPTVNVAIDYTNVDYRDESTTVTLYPLTKNGASASLDLILTPGGVFDGFVRVSNKSAVTGKVIVTMYNDAGSSVTFDLSGGNLAAQASTALISAADLYAQAQTADATFDHNSGKLRATFEGEFGAIAAQSITISTDNTTFTTF